MPNHRIDLKRLARHAMIDRGLWPDFSAKAMAELAQIRAAATDQGPDVQDLRDLLWVSIDNDDSLDLDQITVATEHPDHSVTLLVAIADVDALVPKDSAIDTHARHNTTSVYTSGDIFPMLPEPLSHDLTSLREHQDRVAVVVELVAAAVRQRKRRLAISDAGQFCRQISQLVGDEMNHLAFALDTAAPSARSRPRRC